MLHVHGLPVPFRMLCSSLILPEVPALKAVLTKTQSYTLGENRDDALCIITIFDIAGREKTTLDLLRAA